MKPSLIAIAATVALFGAGSAQADPGPGPGRDLLERLSGSVHLDTLIDERVGVWSGHVLNLETVEGWYHANSVVVSNCKCTIAAVTDNYDPADDLNAIDLNQLYKDAGGTSSAHLKRTRYKVVEHGELGPTLVPKKAYKPRTQKSKTRVGGTALQSDQPAQADVARHQIAVLEANLAKMRADGVSEDSPKVAYHHKLIAKLQSQLGGDEQERPDATQGKPGRSRRSQSDQVKAPDPQAGPGGPTKPPRNIPPVAGSPEDRYRDMDNGEPAPLRPSDVRPLVEDDLAYILDGSGTSGGHRYHTRVPGQTVFPQGWDDAKVRAAIEAVCGGTTIRIGICHRTIWAWFSGRSMTGRNCSPDSRLRSVLGGRDSVPALGRRSIQD